MFYRLAILDVNAAQVGVHGHVLVAVLDEDHVAKTVLYPCKLHHAITHRAHRGACRGCIVGAQVCAPGFQDRVHPHLEAAGHPRKLDGRGEVRAAHAFTLQGVVGAFGCLRFLEPHGFVGLAVVAELGAQHAAGAQRLAIGFQCFVNHSEAVVLAQGAVEIDVAGEDFRHLHGNGIGNVGGVCGCKQ